MFGVDVYNACCWHRLTGPTAEAPIRVGSRGVTLSRFRARQGVNVLGPADLPDFLELTGRDPVVNAFAEYRARSTNLEPRLLAGEIWGRYDGGRLVAGCHVGANLVPVECTPDDARAFAERALTRPRSVVTIVGLQDQVWPLWDCLSDSVGPGPRDPVGPAAPRAGRGRRASSPTPPYAVRRPTTSPCSTPRAWRCTPRRSASTPRPTGERRSTARGCAS